MGPPKQTMYEKFGQFINGEWVKSSSGETYDVINPANEDVIGKASKANSEDIQKAIKLSPSIGLCHLIINTNVILTLFIGYFLFGQTINKTTILGIMVTFIGLAIVLYGSKQ